MGSHPSAWATVASAMPAATSASELTTSRNSFFVLTVSMKTMKNRIGSMKYAFQIPAAAVVSGDVKIEIVAASRNNAMSRARFLYSS